MAEFPIKLNDDYTCQGTGPNGEGVVFEDLLWEGEMVGIGEVPDDSHDRDARPPYGNVVRKDDGLWIVARTDEEEAERTQRLLAGDLDA